jgi:hypothetical protein
VASALVQHSTDGFTWTTLGSGPTTFKTTATGTATYDDVTGLQFGGVNARYVRFGNPANPLTALDFAAGGNFIGLSEVQFYGTPIADVDVQLTGIGAAASTQFGGRPASATVDNSGLSPVVGSSVPGHDTNTASMWLSSNEVLPWIRFDLGSDEFLSKVLVWNYNEANLTTRGVKTATLKYAPASFAGNLSDPNDPNWITLATGVDFTRADQTSAFQAVDGFYFNDTLRYVLLQVTSNYGDSTFTGLSEVQFFTIPEPSSAALLLLGGLWGMRRNMRRSPDRRLRGN